MSTAGAKPAAWGRADAGSRADTSKALVGGHFREPLMAGSQSGMACRPTLAAPVNNPADAEAFRQRRTVPGQLAMRNLEISRPMFWNVAISVAPSEAAK